MLHPTSIERSALPFHLLEKVEVALMVEVGGVLA